jgi:ligand-binding sensor domain-containing protein/two-component sensor histidine kinase
MARSKRNQSLLGGWVLLFIFLALPVVSQRLPITTYTVAEGLAHNNIKAIFQDAKGYLWIATNEGLSRFDGYAFTNYGTEDGLGHIFLNDVTADNRGRLWAATNGGGVSMLIDEPLEIEPDSPTKFATFRIAAGGEDNGANAVNQILFDVENRLWCVTDGGLYRALDADVVDLGFELIVPGTQPTQDNGALRDSRGRLWFSVVNNVTQVIRVANGRTNLYEVRNSTSDPNPSEIHLLTETGDGRILAADQTDIYEYVEPDAPDGDGEWRKLATDIVGNSPILHLTAAPAGGLWIGAATGLVHSRDGQQTLYTTDNGLGSNSVSASFYDREGNLWIGTTGGGISKLSGEDITTFAVAEGLPSPDAFRVVEDRNGRIFAQVGGCRLVEVVGRNRIVPVADVELIPNNLCPAQLLLHDVRGSWWIRTNNGLVHSKRLVSRDGKLVAGPDGLPIHYTELYEDRAGHIWLTSIENGRLLRIENGDPTKVTVAAENVPAEFVVQDRLSGTLWLADRGNIWRLRNGTITKLETIEGLPVLQPRCLFQDSRGRIFVGTRYHGVVFTDEPDTEVPGFNRMTTLDGLASDSVWEVAEDDEGHLYFATGRGVDRFDPSNGRIHHFTSDEGALTSQVGHLLKDSGGNIWASSVTGLMRIDPRTLRVRSEGPPILISHIRIAGVDLPLPETGLTSIGGIERGASQNNIAIRYVGLSLRGENALRYEYKLDGVDQDWVPTGSQREVNFANLGPGDYRFQVRAVNAERLISPHPATFEFRILRPIYMRWWFLALSALAIALISYAGYRNRLQRLLALERTRTRIATDLHDDIGSNLTKISIMSEVARRTTGEKQVDILDSIADISRSSVSSMSDIVWSINPTKDSLMDLLRRMRVYAEETLTQKGIRLEFTASEDFLERKLDADVRRNVYLIFKEVLNNIVRHSGADQVTIDLRIAGSRLMLLTEDNGEGFDADADSDGNGLVNIRRRATDLGGELEISAEPEMGARVRVEVPLKSNGVV